jgi:hypothetical protein
MATFIRALIDRAIGISAPDGANEDLACRLSRQQSRERAERRIDWGIGVGCCMAKAGSRIDAAHRSPGTRSRSSSHDSPALSCNDEC